MVTIGRLWAKAPQYPPNGCKRECQFDSDGKKEDTVAVPPPKNRPLAVMHSSP